eukprot:CAMPEP_0198140750 /NCGR_PEP_ID=MMETSP1443-20131203/3864_1 /TAXON_ID=186043 /ORGANISM="Entomoneis sp., Strain CCMP2396" /LENGTH=354 /DNA_ID=CAMNT_0043803275 /DNA_START=216 /DNA_END=1280 /DNA_ORIENTATION=-
MRPLLLSTSFPYAAAAATMLSSALFIGVSHGFTPSPLLKTISSRTTIPSSSPPSPSSYLKETAADWSSSSFYTAEEQRAWEVFEKFDNRGTGSIDSGELGNMLMMLDVEATMEEQLALFKYLDKDADGSVDFESEFLPWYNDSVEQSLQVAKSFQSLLIGRRTVDRFDQTPVSENVLRRAIECAIAAPNRSHSEPWRFIQVGPETVQKLEAVKEKYQLGSMESQDGLVSTVDWAQVPGWCVVTTKVSSPPTTTDDDTGDDSSSSSSNIEFLNDFKSTSCAVQNFMLSMWSEGIGTKWTSGPVQKTQEFADILNVDTTKERVVGCIWYGFATGGLVNADPKRRKKTVDDVLFQLP